MSLGVECPLWRYNCQLPNLCAQLELYRNWLRPAAMCSWAVPTHADMRFLVPLLEVGRGSPLFTTVIALPSGIQSLRPEPLGEAPDLFPTGRKPHSLTTSVFMDLLFLRINFPVCSLKDLPLGAEGQSTPVLFCPSPRMNWRRQVCLSQHATEGDYQTLPASLSTPYQESGAPFCPHDPRSEKMVSSCQ